MKLRVYPWELPLFPFLYNNYSAFWAFCQKKRPTARRPWAKIVLIGEGYRGAVFGAPAENRRNAFGETDLIHEKVHGEDLVWGPGEPPHFPLPICPGGPPVGGPGGEHNH